MTGGRLKVFRMRLRHGLGWMAAIAVLSTSAAVTCWYFNWLEGVELAAYDRALRVFTGGRGRSPHVALVAMDQQSLLAIRDNPSYARNFGSYPWNRSLWALILEELHHQGARAVVFDGVMDERATDPSGDLALAQALRDTPLPFFLGFSADSGAPPLPAASGPASAEPAPAAGPASAPMAAEGEFVEVAPEEAYPEPTPLESARALAVPVRAGPQPLARLEPLHPRPPLRPLLSAAAGFGLVLVEPDADGKMRRTRFAYADGPNTYLTLPLVAVARLSGASEVELTPGRLRLGSREWSVNADGSAEIDYGGTLAERFHAVSLLSVLDSRVLRDEGRASPLPADALRDKVVVIGGTAIGLGDVKATPFSAEAPGVSKQAAVLDNLLSGHLIVRAPPWVDVGLAAALALLSAAVLMLLRWTVLEVLWPVALVGGTFVLGGAALSAWHLHVAMALPAAAGLLASLCAVASNHQLANREAAFIREAFRRYMDSTLIEQMVAERRLPQLEGENREITAFFSDIRGFSTFSERFREDPRALVRVLNTYLTRVSAALLAEGGCLDKYIGDAVVCLFGAPLSQPDHALRACRAALAVRDTVDRLREEFRAQGLPDVYTRIGLNTAVMFVGNFGSEMLFDYTAMGDGMNLASRLEGANKAYGTLIMIGPRTYEQVREHVEARELDRVRVAGKTEAVAVYELLALKGQLPDSKRRTVERYHQALALYRQARFAEAAQVLRAACAEEPGDGPLRVLLERCEGYIQEPPPMPFEAVASLEK